MNTEMEMVDIFMNTIENASPEQLQHFCDKQIKKGGKYAILARFVMGELDENEFEKLLRPYFLRDDV